MKKTVCYLIICLCIVWAAGFILFNRTINTYQTDNRTKTDAIIALTGGRNRISAAVKLLNEEMAPRLLISGVQKDIPRKEPEDMQYGSLAAGCLLLRWQWECFFFGFICLLKCVYQRR